MWVIFAIALLLIAIAVRFHEKRTNAICASTKRLNARTALVTGGTAGMGLEIAKEFARRGAKVIIACPFQEEGDSAREEIVRQTGNQKVIFKLLNLASFDSVRKFAADILKDEDRLDILINNAGVGVPKEFITADRVSFIMQVNYFGHFLLTLLLLPLLKMTGTSSDPARVVNTSSIAHRMGIVDIDNLNRNRYWFTVMMYARSKVCLVLFAHELAKRLRGSDVIVNSVDPGAVGTRIFDSAGKLNGLILRFLCAKLYKTPWEGAQTALHVALDTEAGTVSGQFFKNCKKTRAARWAYSDKLARKLWEESTRLVNISQDEVDNCFTSS